MFKRVRSHGHREGIVHVLLGVVLTLGLSGTAMAVTDTSFTYSTPRTGYLMLGAGDLVPASEYDVQDFSLHPFYGASSLDTSCFRAGVHLPNGAKVKSVKTFLQSDDGGDLSYELGRTNPVDGAHVVLASRVIAENSDVRTSRNHEVPSTYATVNNAQYLYTLSTCTDMSSRWLGARITYTYTNAGD